MASPSPNPVVVGSVVAHPGRSAAHCSASSSPSGSRRPTAGRRSSRRGPVAAASSQRSSSVRAPAGIRPGGPPACPRPRHSPRPDPTGTTPQGTSPGPEEPARPVRPGQRPAFPGRVRGLLLACAQDVFLLPRKSGPTLNATPTRVGPCPIHTSMNVVCGFGRPETQSYRHEYRPHRSLRKRTQCPSNQHLTGF
jgi:hypothetical protein